MKTPITPSTTTRPARSRLWATAIASLIALNAAAQPTLAPAVTDWQACKAVTDAAQRLACFDQWAARQTGTDSPPAPHRSAEPVVAHIAIPARQAAAQEAASRAVVAGLTAPQATGCHSSAYSPLSRIWELEEGSDCGTFDIRGYRPISLALIGSDGVNRQPASGNPLNNATVSQAYQSMETRIQLSVRTKVAQGLLTRNSGTAKDSIWFGYTQQSYWQLFNGSLSRPFRSTDHEPEILYIYPTDALLPAGWRLRYSGLSVVHQSNGQSLPLSRSWNRVVLMAGLERGHSLRVQGRLWRRLPEPVETDDNPRISDFVGRAEVAAHWDATPNDTLGFVGRHSLARINRGSARIEWLRRVGGNTSTGLRFHTQLFNGYGDSLLDYNRRRTVLSLGLSLVDW